MSEMKVETIRHALEVARRNGFRVVRLTQDAAQFRAVLGESECHEPEPLMETLEMAAIVTEEPSNGHKEIGATHVGYFHFGKQPLQVGDKVEVGQVVGEIHALGIANDVTAAASGEIVEILAVEGEALEFGKALFKVKV